MDHVFPMINAPPSQDTQDIENALNKALGNTISLKPLCLSGLEKQIQFSSRPDAQVIFGLLNHLPFCGS